MGVMGVKLDVDIDFVDNNKNIKKIADKVIQDIDKCMIHSMDSYSLKIMKKDPNDVMIYSDIGEILNDNKKNTYLYSEYITSIKKSYEYLKKCMQINQKKINIIKKDIDKINK